MKWVTRDHVHMDRIASPWLIRRFIDPGAEFLFVPFGREHPLPADAIPFAIPGVEIGPCDESGSTFRKLMTKYEVSDPALDMMADIIESGIEHVFHQNDAGYTVGQLKYPHGVGLDAVAIGMMFATRDDADNLEKSLPLYEGLFTFCRIKRLLSEQPQLAAIPYPAYWDAVAAELRRSA